jgi:hypothetical protein
MAGTRTTPETSSDTAKKKDEGGGIEYVDMGDYTLEIDRRLDVEQRRKIPKSQRDIVLSQEQHEELEERLKVENEVREQEREEAEKPLEVPPLEEKRKKGEEPPSVTVTASGEEREKAS